MAERGLEMALLVAGMAAVTYLPRLAPFLVRMRTAPGSWQRRFFSLVPFAAIGALLVPGALTAVDGRLLPSVAGLLAAATAAWLTKQPFVTVVVAVAAVAAVLALGG